VTDGYWALDQKPKPAAERETTAGKFTGLTRRRLE